MKHLVTCSNAGEAGFYQSMLASSGIDSELRDGRSDITTVPAAQLFVREEQYAQAAALIASETVTEPKKDPPVGHPAAGFPFLGIMGFTAIVWSFASVVLVAFSLDSKTWDQLGVARALLQLLSIGAIGFLWGLLVGAPVALFCLIAKVTWQKLRA